ncbi:MAG: Recombination endonuclease [Frankiales bacterium]|nr:Recombination endonuclease [Frankiales bacterium]
MRPVTDPFSSERAASLLRVNKTCLDGGISKPLDDFPRHRNMEGGRHRYCRDCMNVRSRESYRRRQARKGRQVREPELLPTGTKRCRDCSAVLPLDGFPRNKNSKDGRHPYCKPCHSQRGEETRQRLYGGGRHCHLMLRYGIAAAAVERMIEEQSGLRARCGENPPEHVDHDHETGEVRGILCFNCNGGLGQFKDRVDILTKAITYLERTRDPLWLSSDFTDDFPLPTQRREAALSPTSCEQLRLSF